MIQIFPTFYLTSGYPWSSNGPKILETGTSLKDVEDYGLLVSSTPGFVIFNSTVGYAGGILNGPPNGNPSVIWDRKASIFQRPSASQITFNLPLEPPSSPEFVACPIEYAITPVPTDAPTATPSKQPVSVPTRHPTLNRPSLQIEKKFAKVEKKIEKAEYRDEKEDAREEIRDVKEDAREGKW